MHQKGDVNSSWCLSAGVFSQDLVVNYVAKSSLLEAQYLYSLRYGVFPVGRWDVHMSSYDEL